MRFTWLWIIVYFAWACGSLWNPSQGEAHSIGDLLLVVLLLCAVNLFAVGRKCALGMSLAQAAGRYYLELLRRNYILYHPFTNTNRVRCKERPADEVHLRLSAAGGHPTDLPPAGVHGAGACDRAHATESRSRDRRRGGTWHEKCEGQLKCPSGEVCLDPLCDVCRLRSNGPEEAAGGALGLSELLFHSVRQDLRQPRGDEDRDRRRRICLRRGCGAARLEGERCLGPRSDPAEADQRGGGDPPSAKRLRGGGAFNIA